MACTPSLLSRVDRRAWLMATVALAWAAMPPAARAADTVLRGQEVTVDRLTDSLLPRDPAVKTRQIRQAPAGASPARPAAALLITFETASATLTPAARRQLDVVGAALRNERLQGYRFGIEGHADPRGQADDNRALSQSRAESVRDYLVATHGIPAERLEPVGKGSSEPMNRRRPDAPENRRVTIVTQSKP